MEVQRKDFVNVAKRRASASRYMPYFYWMEALQYQPASHSLVNSQRVRRRSDASKAMRPWAADEVDATLAAQLLVDMLSVRHNNIGMSGYPAGKTDASAGGNASSIRVIVAASWIKATANSRQFMWILSGCFLGRLARRRISGLQI